MSTASTQSAKAKLEEAMLAYRTAHPQATLAETEAAIQAVQQGQMLGPLSKAALKEAFRAAGRALPAASTARGPEPSSSPEAPAAAAHTAAKAPDAAAAASRAARSPARAAHLTPQPRGPPLLPSSASAPSPERPQHHQQQQQQQSHDRHQRQHPARDHHGGWQDQHSARDQRGQRDQRGHLPGQAGPPRRAGARDGSLDGARAATDAASPLATYTAAGRQIPPAHACRPVLIRDLPAGDFVENTILRGTLRERPVGAAATITVLFEDEAGEVLRTAIAVSLPEALVGPARQATIDAMYGPGVHIGIIEPFFLEPGADGGACQLLVAQPSQVIWLEALPAEPARASRPSRVGTDASSRASHGRSHDRHEADRSRVANGAASSHSGGGHAASSRSRSRSSGRSLSDARARSSSRADADRPQLYLRSSRDRLSPDALIKTLAYFISGSILCDLLLSIASTYSAMEQLPNAARFANASLAIRPTARGFFLVARAFGALGLSDAALWCAVQSSRLERSADADALVAELEKSATYPPLSSQDGFTAAVRAIATIGPPDWVAKNATTIGGLTIPDTTGRQAVKLKAEGDAHFAQGHFQDALDLYLLAFASLDSPELCAIVLSNRAASRFKSRRFKQAILDVSAALLLDPCHAKSWCRLVLALAGLEWLSQAAASIDAALEYCPDHLPLVTLRCRLEEMVAGYESQPAGEDGFRDSDAPHDVHSAILATDPLDLIQQASSAKATRHVDGSLLNGDSADPASAYLLAGQGSSALDVSADAFEQLCIELGLDNLEGIDDEDDGDQENPEDDEFDDAHEEYHTPAGEDAASVVSLRAEQELGLSPRDLNLALQDAKAAQSPRQPAQIDREREQDAEDADDEGGDDEGGDDEGDHFADVDADGSKDREAAVGSQFGVGHDASADYRGDDDDDDHGDDGDGIYEGDEHDEGDEGDEGDDGDEGDEGDDGEEGDPDGEYVDGQAQLDSESRFVMSRDQLPVQIKFEGRPTVAPFHHEYAVHNAFLPQAEPDACMAFLQTAFDKAYAVDLFELAWTTYDRALVKRQFMTLPSARPGLTAPLIKWFGSAVAGTVRFGPRVDYDAERFSSFGRAPCHYHRLFFGARHVAVEFGDLGELLARDLQPGEKPNGPLHWTGIDRSPYNVAKALVVAEMIQMQAVSDAILQVWYSAAWSQRTHSSFQAALGNVLARNDQPESVAAILQHWLGREVPLSQARDEWLESMTPEYWATIADLADEADRVAFASYVLTGEVLKATLGSTVMFANPSAVGVRERDECFLRAIDPAALWNCRRNGAPDVITAAAAILYHRITKLKEEVESGAVRISVRLGHVSPTEAGSVALVRGFEPSDISWGNLIDYHMPSDFHLLAQQCAEGNASMVHFVYPRTWARDVIGTFARDYIGVRRDARLSMLRSGKHTVSNVYARRHISDYIISPPIRDAHTLIDYFLHTTYQKNWAEAFMNAGITMEAICRVDSIAFDYSIFSLDSEMLYLTFAYKPRV
ncbi:hypothetical protein HK105_200805 [Polyrhizophydium stewartii]|uniref:Uncharacterized protein n=1 Tax=Polyrhizophydium stewartii TaxID=2732419 RepID=A0ABR4NK32_9FUNG|nr:hypothetical protein HK105_007671 [Polyrhizophydium stewartii]